ncbi:ferredoxin [Methanohalobium sp.]|uniref:ferredoxin n=1 Tax=Methanohalobium sp. TaxID=2837493 RepID=UPI0025E164EB|nr:ferredoxin [Methanohalobium sp.]
MADKTNKVPENIEGSYYVDEDCTACGLCVDTDPDHFAMNDDESYAYVYKQPETDDEIDACEEALEACPVEAIGNDG